MIFAFLFGLSMDYEVFIISRIREIYDDTGDTSKAISMGIARTGKLVTSAALVLVFAFFALSTGPGPDIKQFGIGLAAGILIDATLIRSVLVPSIMQLMGDANWWFPPWIARDPLREDARRCAGAPGSRDRLAVKQRQQRLGDRRRRRRAAGDPQVDGQDAPRPGRRAPPRRPSRLQPSAQSPSATTRRGSGIAR